MDLRIRRKDITIVLGLYFALKPIYLWSSGSVQIADIILIFGTLIYILSNHGRLYLSTNHSSITKLLFGIVAYQTLINLIWFFPTQDELLLKSSLYYIFNFIAFYITVSIGEKNDVESIKNAIAKGSIFSILITLIGMLLVSNGSRNTGFFNNPNQLGYYAVIMLTVLLYLNVYFSKMQKIVLFIGAFWAIIASLSKAAILGAFGLLLVFLLFYQKKRTLKRLFVQFSLLLTVVFVIYFLFFSNSTFVLNNKSLYAVRYRILYMMSENDSDLGIGRGYARVMELGAHFLWGMGEGAYYRFSIKTNAEIHATFISLLVSYGLLGLVGYIVFFRKCLVHKGLTIRNLTIMTGVFLYSLTHNGIRNTLLWILMAVLLIDNNVPESTMKTRETVNEI